MNLDKCLATAVTANDNDQNIATDCVGHCFAVDDLVVVKRTKVQQYGTFLLIGIISEISDNSYMVRPIVSSHPIDLTKLIKICNPLQDMVAVTEDFFANILAFKLSN